MACTTDMEVKGALVEHLDASVDANEPTAAERAFAEEIHRLIEQLNHQDFQVRDKATRRLIEIGVPALPALQKARESSSAEVRRRVQSVLTKLPKLTLNLLVRTDRYQLNLNGKEPDEFRKLIEALTEIDTKNPSAPGVVADRYPAPPKVDLILELKNNTNTPINFFPFGRRIMDQYLRQGRDPADIVFDGGAFVDFEIRGPGALKAENQKAIGPVPDAEGFVPVPLRPDKVFSWPVRELRFGPHYYNHAGLRNRIYWTEPGYYALRAVLHAATEGENGQFTPIQIRSNWVKLMVVAK